MARKPITDIDQIKVWWDVRRAEELADFRAIDAAHPDFTFGDITATTPSPEKRILELCPDCGAPQTESFRRDLGGNAPVCRRVINAIRKESLRPDARNTPPGTLTTGKKYIFDDYGYVTGAIPISGKIEDFHWDMITRCVTDKPLSETVELRRWLRSQVRDGNLEMDDETGLVSNVAQDD